MKVSQLNEGIIDIPPYLIKKAEIELLRFIATSMYTISDLPELFARYQFPCLAKHNLKFMHYGEAYDVADGETLAVEVPYYHEHIKYSTREGKSFYRIGATIDDKNPRTLGLYAKNHNAIIVNLYKLFKNIADELAIAIWFDNDLSAHTQEYIDETTEYTVRAIDKYIERFMEYASGTIEHELGHMIQAQYLGDRDDHVSAKENGVGYLISDPEFHPTIAGILNAFKVLHEHTKDHPDATKEYYRLIFRRIVQLPWTVEEAKKFSHIKDDSTFHTLSLDSSFFEALKAHRKDKWKVAIKYMFTELQKLDIV